MRTENNRNQPNIWVTACLAIIMIGTMSLWMPKNDEKYQAKTFWTKKTFAASQFDVIVMGDSRVYRSIDPHILEQYLPDRKILNFGYSDGGLNPEMFQAAESKFNHQSQDKRMILGISANCLTRYTEPNRQYKQELMRPREERMAHLYFNPVLYRFSATSPQKLYDLCSPINQSEKRINQYNQFGYVVSDHYPIDTMRSYNSYVKDYSKYKVEERNIQQLVDQVQKWTNNKIKVYAYRPPIPKHMEILEDTMGLYNEAKIRASLEDAGCLWIDLDMKAYKTYDGSHLTLASAKKISNDIGAFISGQQ